MQINGFSSATGSPVCMDSPMWRKANATSLNGGLGSVRAGTPSVDDTGESIGDLVGVDVGDSGFWLWRSRGAVA